MSWATFFQTLSYLVFRHIHYIKVSLTAKPSDGSKGLQQQSNYQFTTLALGHQTLETLTSLASSSDLSLTLSLARFFSCLVFQPWTYPISVFILHHCTIVTIINTCDLSWGCITIGLFLSLSYFRHFPGAALALPHVFILIFFSPIKLLLWSFFGH